MKLTMKEKALVLLLDAHNIAEINNAIFSMHDGITPDSQNEEFGISISLKELPKSEYEELISKEWEA